MEKHALKILEFNKFLEIVVNFAQLSTTKTKIKENIFYSPQELDNQYALIETINDIQELFPLPTIQAYNSIMTLLNELQQENSYPQPEEAANLASFLEISGRLKNWFEQIENKQPAKAKKIGQICSKIVKLDWLYDKINRIVDDKFNIKSSASSKLQSLRHNIASEAKNINSALQNIIHKPSNELFIQEKIITIRDDRFVIPVKSSHRGKISGFIHDQSASGETVYIEPAVVLSLNNKLKILYFEEKEEIRAILLDLGNDIRSNLEGLKNTENAVIEFDFLHTKIRFHEAYNCSKPIFSETIDLKYVRHPLLGESAVPINISFGEENNTLIISGPNTGGKTVSLKTLGLISLIAQSGFFIPAAKNSKLKYFSEIYCDIGDEQSIENNLSTFSSHISNIAHIFNNADKKSLVIIDEPGAGTDPEEGSILGMAILKELLKKEITTITTTHYNKIKNWGFVTKHVENGSMKYEPEQLIPSYKISYKIPGASHAFEIAAQLGLPAYIIEDCQKMVDPETSKTNTLLNSLEMQILNFEKNKDELQEQKRLYEKSASEYKEKIDKINNKKDEIIAEAKKQKELIIKKGKDKINLLIKKLKSNNQPISAKEESQIKQSLKTKNKNEKITIENNNPLVNKIDINKLSIGDKVEIISLGKIGQISKLNRTKDEISVALGSIEIVIKSNNLKAIAKLNKNKKMTSYTGRYVPSIQILDIRGERFEAAQDIVRKFFDNAISSEAKKLSIIHGKGSGALQEAVKEVVEEYPAIIFLGFAKPQDGGAGRSEIEVKSS